MSRIADIARDFAERGGKRLRPRLCQAVFEACGGKGDLSPVCEAMESFHKASLVHDDIQDGDETRYGRPTVWKEHGVTVAIAVGDWLVAHGYLLIARSGFARAPRLLEAVAAAHLRLCEGQGDDLLGVVGTADYVSMCARKTGEAFALAAQLGALAAGADDAKFRRYGLAFGILFQVNDDIADGAADGSLSALKEKYENETALYRDECALGVW